MTSEVQKVLVDLDTEGKIKSEVQGLYIGSFSVMPTASQTNQGCTVFYNGNTGTYIKDTYYTCIEDTGTYTWKEASTSISKQIGTYDQTVKYMVDSVVMYNGEIYISVQNNNINHTPPNQNYWKGVVGVVGNSYTATITGDGQTSSWTFTHGLGSTPVSVQLTYASTGQVVQADTTLTPTVITVTMAQPLQSGVVLTLVQNSQPGSNKFTSTITGDGSTTTWTIAHPFGVVPNSVLITFSDGSAVETTMTIGSQNVVITTSLPLEEGETINVLIAI